MTGAHDGRTLSGKLIVPPGRTLPELLNSATTFVQFEAIDSGRMYLAKARLQQACDAGALAGRKVMGSNTWAANGGAANTAALQFFDGNFANGAYGTTGRTRSFTENAGRVTGTASVTVPMSVMNAVGECVSRPVPGRSMPRGASEPPLMKMFLLSSATC